MYLFIDTLSVKTCLLLFRENLSIVDHMNADFKQKEFEILPSTLHQLLQQHEIRYDQLQGIVVLNGPGSFTGLRVTCLITNAIAFAYQIPLFPLNYFTFLELQNKPYPYAIQANKREILVKSDRDTPPYIMRIEELVPEGQYQGSGESIAFLNYDTRLCTDMQYISVIRDIDLSSPVSCICPIYVRDPHISSRT